MFARCSLKQKRPRTFHSVVIWNNGHSRAWCAGLRMCPPFLYFYVLIFIYQLKYWVALTLRLVFFPTWWFLGTVEKLAWGEIPGHLLDFTFIFPEAKSWWLMAFPFRGCDLDLIIFVWPSKPAKHVITTCYSLLVFDWARFMIHVHVRNAKLNVYWR